MVYGVAPGVDSIIYSLSNACGTSNAYFYFTVTDEHTTGINNTGAGETSSMIIAPNPAKEQVSIKVLSSYSEPVTILVTNVLGEKLMTIKGFTNQPISEFIGFPAGTYISSASGEHEQLSSKIVKE